MIELKILEDSLRRKKEILARVSEENKKQEAALRQNPAAFDDFEAIVEQKSVLIDELLMLDDGFGSVYDRIKTTFLANRSQFAAEIAIFQTLISDITTLSVSIQAQEERNKTLVESILAGNRKDIQGDRVRAKTAYDFMNRMAHDAPPRFMDEKK